MALPSPGRRAALLFAFITLALCGLIGRLVYINTSMSPRLIAIANAQQEMESVIPARRGSIRDSRGRVLAGSRLRYSVFADPACIERPDEVAAQLAPVLEMSAGEIENEIRTSSTPRFCWLKRCLDDTQTEAIESLKLPGIGLRGEFERHWPVSRVVSDAGHSGTVTVAAQVLGFVGVDGQGLEGLELVHDDHLRGVPGKRSSLCDARRHPIGQGRSPLVEPQDGGHLVLTIDSVIQTIVEKRLRQQINEFGAESGIAIVVDPRTGDILAMANEPSLNLADYNSYVKDRRRNRAITDPVEPGSTFKPFIIAGALEGGFVNTHELIDCHNGLHFFGGRRLRDTKPHGLMSVRDVVIYSSNIGMGVIGTRMGNGPLHTVITGFGFGSPTGIGLPGESAGIVLPLAQWNSYSTTSVTMGQELAITPLQLAMAFSAIMNDGQLVRPRIVRAKLAADYSVLESYEGPIVVRQSLADSTAKYLAEDVLVGVVSRGGKELDLDAFTMCGKTGTAQVPYIGTRRGYQPGVYLSSFIGAAPVSDPRIVTLVMIRKPDASRGYFGRVVAGPAVRDIIRSTLRYMGVPEEEQVAQRTEGELPE
jgi:cell division protein FtsI/penicillin-binding protein 2